MTIKFRTTAVAFIAALFVSLASQSLAPASAQAAIKHRPGANAELNAHCDELAGLVNAALAKEQEALNQDPPDRKTADEWRDYANRHLAAGRSDGCDWYAARSRDRNRIPQPRIPQQILSKG